jgi:hypothetical protein
MKLIFGNIMMASLLPNGEFFTIMPPQHPGTKAADPRYSVSLVMSGPGRRVRAGLFFGNPS